MEGVLPANALFFFLAWAVCQGAVEELGSPWGPHLCAVAVLVYVQGNTPVWRYPGALRSGTSPRKRYALSG
jgi:hypothetical protein